MSINATSYSIVEFIGTILLWNNSGKAAWLGKTPHFVFETFGTRRKSDAHLCCSITYMNRTKRTLLSRVIL